MQVPLLSLVRRKNGWTNAWCMESLCSVLPAIPGAPFPALESVGCSGSNVIQSPACLYHTHTHTHQAVQEGRRGTIQAEVRTPVAPVLSQGLEHTCRNMTVPWIKDINLGH